MGRKKAYVDSPSFIIFNETTISCNLCHKRTQNKNFKKEKETSGANMLYIYLCGHDCYGLFEENRAASLDSDSNAVEFKVL